MRKINFIILPNYIINLNHYIPFNDIFYIDQTIQTNNNNINEYNLKYSSQRIIKTDSNSYTVQSNYSFKVLIIVMCIYSLIIRGFFLIFVHTSIIQIIIVIISCLFSCIIITIIGYNIHYYTYLTLESNSLKLIKKAHYLQRKKSIR